MESILTQLESEVKQEFEKNNRLLTFQEYLKLVETNPQQHTRGSAQYILDMFDFFGKSETKSGQLHFNLFDLEFDQSRSRVIGQDEVQLDIYRTLQNFVKEGVNNKLILLHGPNGSAKSSLVNCMIRGLEHYSTTSEGAQYKFNWIFPVDKVSKGTGGLGLSSYSGAKNQIDSYARLNDEDISAKITCELKDHPLLLINEKPRQQLLNQMFSKKDQPNFPEYLTRGNLCHKCKQIYEALLANYKGDLKKVLMHVQVERFYVSKRYRNAAVTIEPQMHVDAAARQVTMDRNLSYLPPSLHSLSLYELSGDLVEGNRGLVEYADLLKRPVDMFKYLLVACESGSISVNSTIAFLDTVLIGSTNELQLDAFKEFPDFVSFKARIELIRVPYLLEYSEEKKIYDLQIDKMAGKKHVTPYTTYVIALWAVLTRLKKPNAIHYQPNLTNIVSTLTPLEKARLYDHLETPAQLSAEEKKLLKVAIKRIREEYSAVPYYEGRMGASAREIKSILYDAAQNHDFPCLSPLAVFKEIDEFVKRITEYEFLKQDIKDGYHDNGEFIQIARKEYLQILDQEVRSAMGIFEARQYQDFLKKYVVHLSHLLKKEKIKNSITGQMESPDLSLIEEFESIISAPTSVTEKDIFRNNVISSIGAYALDHKQASFEYGDVFPEFMKKLENHYFDQQKSQMKKLADAIQFFGTDKEDHKSDHHKLAKRTIETLINQKKYCEDCAKQSVLFLVKSRY